MQRYCLQLQTDYPFDCKLNVLHGLRLQFKTGRFPILRDSSQLYLTVWQSHSFSIGSMGLLVAVMQLKNLEHRPGLHSSLCLCCLHASSVCFSWCTRSNFNKNLCTLQIILYTFNAICMLLCSYLIVQVKLKTSIAAEQQLLVSSCVTSDPTKKTTSSPKRKVMSCCTCTRLQALPCEVAAAKEKNKSKKTTLSAGEAFNVCIPEIC